MRIRVLLPVAVISASFVATAEAVVSVKGDYNNDSIVNAADYTLWRNSVGSGTPIHNGSGIVPVGIQDFYFWRDRYGNGFGTGSIAVPFAGAPIGVPEPTSAALCGISLLLLIGSNRSRRRHM